MFASLTFNLRQRISDWIFRARFPERPPVLLIQRRIFILPSRTGYFFVVVLVLLFIASVNYSLSLGYLLTFLLTSMGGMAMFHTFRNLLRLSISPGKVEPVFAGDTAHFSIVLANQSLPRYAIGIKRAQVREAEPEFGDAAEDASATFLIPMVAEKRGHMKCGRLEIFTEYPVGLFHAWSYVDFGDPCLVYPKPDPGAGSIPLDMRAQGQGNVAVRGDEEFQSLRAYRAGDTPRQIAWKALARGQGLLVKEFGATASADLWLDYESLHGLSMEQRLSRLTWWVLDAERTQIPYGLKLPDTNLRPAQGQKHRDQCLRALALYGLAA